MQKIKCQVCEVEFPRNEIVAVEGINVCPEYKPVFAQKLREGMNLPGGTGPNEKLDKEFRSLRSTWFIVLGTLLLYLCIALFKATKGRPMDESSLAMMRIALYTFAFICLVASQYVRKLMVSNARRQISSERLPRSSAPPKYQGAVVLPLIMCEFIGICGIFLFASSRNALDLYLMLVVAAVGMVMNRPKKEELVGLAEASPVPLSSEPSNDLKAWKMEPELAMPKPRILRSSTPRRAWLWYPLIAVFPLLFFSLHFHPHDHLLSLYVLNHGKPGVGTVESTKHVSGYRYRDDLLRFSYTAPSGQSYHADAHVDSELLRLNKGFFVRIHYLPTRPDIAALDNDGGRLKSDLILFSCFVFGLSLLSLFLDTVWRSRLRKTQRILSVGDVVPGVIERTARMVFDLYNGGYRLSLRYSYNNREWQSVTKTSVQDVTFSPGDVITLLVDPADPKSVVAYAVCGYRVVGPGREGSWERGVEPSGTGLTIPIPLSSHRSTSRSGLLVIALLLVVLAVVCLTNRNRLFAFFLASNNPAPALGIAATPPPNRAEITANKLLLGESAKVHGKYSIAANPMEELDFKTKQEIYDLRKARVLQHPGLAPENYAPSEAVFGQITDKKPWWGLYGIYFYGNGEKSIEGPSEQSVFLLNPYLLVGLREPRAFRIQLTPPDEHVIFYPQPLNVEWEAETGRALITYNVHDHYRHMTAHHYYPTPEYRLDLIAYNARDLGLSYLYVDTDKSESVVPLLRMEKAFPINQFVHCGGSCGYPGGCNNISPAGPPELTLEIKKLPTRVQVKLWRNEPKSVADRCDMTVTIQML